MLFHTANGREKSINFVHFLVISSLRVTCDFGRRPALSPALRPIPSPAGVGARFKILPYFPLELI